MKLPDDCKDIQEIRNEIDRIDRDIIKSLGN
jgi:chorismate mutase